MENSVKPPPTPQERACRLLMRTKGWAKVVCQGFLKTLQANELEALAKLETDPQCHGDLVTQILDEIEDRIQVEREKEPQEEPPADLRAD